MAEFFGGVQPSGNGEAGASKRGSPSAADPAAASSGHEAALLSEVQAANAELFGFFGMRQPRHEDGPGPSLAAAAFVHQLAALSGQPAAGPGPQPIEAACSSGSWPTGSNAAHAKINNSSSNTREASWAAVPAAAGAEAGSSSGGGGGGAGGLTHVDATGKAAMVDVSHVSAPAAAPLSISGYGKPPAAWWCKLGGGLHADRGAATPLAGAFGTASWWRQPAGLPVCSS